MILKSNHSKSQFKSFSHYLEENYENINNSNNKYKFDNSDEENENSFL